MPSGPPVAHARPATPTMLAVLVALAAFAGGILGTGAAELGADREVAAVGESPTVQAEATPPSTPLATSSPEATPASSPSVTPSPEPEPHVRFTVVAAGDVLTHTPVNASARTEDDYDYTTLMAPARPFIEQADLALCHLETPVAPEGTVPSGYPRFAAPAALVRDLAAVGWDGCSVASNHVVDQGLAGMQTTLAALADNGLASAGATLTEDAPRTAFYSLTGDGREVTVAQVSFTYGTNGLPLPEGMPWSVDLFDADAADATPIIDAAQAARDQGADVVIASVHCCVEYQTAPTDAQRAIVEQIAASGAVDLYVGHHAHVPQPIERLEGGPTGEGMWAAFGLGNFLSNQDDACCAAETGSGVLLTATFDIDPEGVVDVRVEWTGTTLDRRDGHTVQVLEAIQDTGTGTLSPEAAQERLAMVRAAVGDQAPERSEPALALADAMDNGVD